MFRAKALCLELLGLSASNSKASSLAYDMIFVY